MPRINRFKIQKYLTYKRGFDPYTAEDICDEFELEVYEFYFGSSRYETVSEIVEDFFFHDLKLSDCFL